MANIRNLKPFTGTNAPRRQNGRKKGSKNLSTIVNELLEANIELTEPLDEWLVHYSQNSTTTYAKAIALSMIIKAINGDVRAATWISGYADRQPDSDSFFHNPNPIVFQVVSDRPREEGD